ncbi:MAG TPA: PKD domain-containing protein [Candidatus Dormibacteraeota bacterium]|nr:PKD domain-containing protein [Candidatus Dormibacteraeota bacterium]
MKSRTLVLLAAISWILPICAWLLAATPPSGTLTDASGPVNYTSGPFTGVNPTPVLFVDSGPECLNPVQPCDDFALTVTLPSGYAAAHPNAAIKVTMSWIDAGSGKSDYDLYIYKGTVINTDGSQTADYQSASSANPEVATISPVADGTRTFTVKVVPYTPTGESVSVKIELLSGSGGGGSGFGGPDPTAPGVPRYRNFYAPEGTSAENGSQGEFNIGFNPHSGRILTMNLGPIWRLTPAELLTPALPECCEALWEDRSTLTTNLGLDPILFTDQKSGRTFASNSTAGANAVYAYSDNDGDLWIEVGAGPPDGGADHETIGTGPFPASLSVLGTPLNQGENTLYCSQDVVGPAMCQRSLDLGMTWGPGVPAYTGSGPQGCGGLHGHVHVAPNGTAWLPVRQCNGRQGGVTSTDAGTTWTEFVVGGSLSQPQGADPSVAIDSDSTAYYCYVNNEPVPAGNPPEGHVHVKVSHDGGLTWINDFDIGASHGIKNAVHTEAIGGSPGRAACGFIGSNVAGDYQANSFPGIWYAFIATTYDGGRTWVTVNATPNDPVQSTTGVWQQGGSHQDRNLLDFNEITVDDKGRVLYGYSDGCVSPGCVAGTAENDFTAFMRVARQSGGKGLFAANDTVEPVAPKPPCLSGTRDAAGSHLSWKAPDNGGSDIVDYQIFRGTSPGSEVFLGQTGNVKTTFDDATADPSVAHYYYVVKAQNAVGAGGSSDEVNLTVAIPPPPENVCALPGLTRLTDPSGDTSAVVGITTTPAPPGSDLLSFQISQPYSTDGVVRLAFTINTDAGESPQPAGSAWYVAMKIPDPAPATTFHYRGVHMAWPGPTPVFQSYTPGPNSGGGIDGRFVTPGTARPAEASSSYASPFSRVVIVVKASDLGLNPGDTISGFVSGVSQSSDPANIGAGATALYDQMPDSLAFTGTYTVRTNQACSPEGPPVAVLQATPNTGCAPLSVTFDGSQSYDPDGDAIVSYRFDFGDGSAPVTQSSPTTTHAYGTAGDYSATLQVTCSRDAVGSKTAQALVSVAAPPAAPVITAPSTARPNQSGLIASVASHSGSRYNWSISNGTITAGQGTSRIRFTAGTKGSVTLSVTEISAAGCVSPAGTATVTIGRK